MTLKYHRDVEHGQNGNAPDHDTSEYSANQQTTQENNDGQQGQNGVQADFDKSNGYAFGENFTEPF